MTSINSIHNEIFVLKIGSNGKHHRAWRKCCRQGRDLHNWRKSAASQIDRPISAQAADQHVMIDQIYLEPACWLFGGCDC